MVGLHTRPRITQPAHLPALDADLPPPPRRRSWFRARPRQWVNRIAYVLTVLILAGVGFLVHVYMTVSLPPASASAAMAPTSIRDAQGGTLADLVGDHERVDVPLSAVSISMQRAVIAAEDRHFYRHSGVDPTGLTRAFINDLRGRSLQGGSTITQQLVKNAYLSSNRSMMRKLKEAVLAIKLEQRMSKHAILERYLNTVYFGRGAYGVESAAERYFGIHASQLDVPQSALLAGLIRAPELADPAVEPLGAFERRAKVLESMRQAKMITPAEEITANTTPIGARARQDPLLSLSGDAAYFTAMVERWAVQRFGEQRALSGLRIDTTLDPELETAAADAIAWVLNRPDDPDAALVSMTDDGAVVALVGGKDFRRSAVNLAINATRPQAGSTFKPFVLTTALAEGTLVSKTYSGPEKLTVTFPRFPPYEVENFGRESFGELNLADATAHSVNTIYAQLARDTGLANIGFTAHALGIDTPVPVVPSMPLGTANVSPMEMLRAYMTFATRGVRVEPYFVREVRDHNGTVLFRAHPVREQVLQQKYADTVNAILTGVIDHGTGRNANIGRPAAGKTGTTSNNTDAWFIGYTPRLGTAVWMGYQSDYHRSMNNVHGIEAVGGSFPALMWRAFMTFAVDGKDTGAFVAPPPDVFGPPPPPPPIAAPTSSPSPTTTAPATTVPPTSSTTVPPPTTTSTSTSSTVTTTTVKPHG